MAVTYLLEGKPYKQPAMAGEKVPSIIWGTGAADGDAEPFLSANKGSLYIQVDATDDAAHLAVKIDEGGDDNDWDYLPLSTHTHV